MAQIQSTLLPDERCVMTSDDGALTLTNFRVKYEGKVGRGQVYKSIMLSKVSGCAVTTRTYPLLLVFAGLAALGTIATPQDPVRITFAAIALILFFSYFITRRGQLEVFSDSGASIALPTSGLKHEIVRSFAEAVALQATKGKW
ncbi:hypothetical protein [Acidovorax sp.]|uniref:hypothetical protein n=1 Tax=Acidovorax sp. TaxID=1872122 RepID=UPI0025C27425|nr:hypothetical protein [Acidovorax sp.]MBL7088087.1 hypothetical protein [Acidovorax sp.]